MPRHTRPWSHQTAGMRATWQPIDGLPPLPRSSHSLDVVAGSAYMFGGETSPRELADNDMLVVRLPYSGAGADYYKVKAVAATDQERRGPEGHRDLELQHEETTAQRDLQDVPLEESPPSSKGKEPATVEHQRQPLSESGAGPVPAPRIGHATAVIGSRIFLFGGRAGRGLDVTPLDEAGRVWVFDTRSCTWTYLDPVAAVRGSAIVPHPVPRSYHCATATEHPRDLPSAVRKPQTWRQWAVGDSARTGIPQDPIIGNVAEEAVDHESDGYGTFLVHAGCLGDGEHAGDLWAFDVALRTWTELPYAPGTARGGTSMCISESRLYRFGGFDGTGEQLGVQLDFLPLQLGTFDDGAAKAERSIASHIPGWQAMIPYNPDASVEQPWPSPRCVASLHALGIGGGGHGREYLVLAMGDGSDASLAFLDDVWAYQVPPPLGLSAASLTDAVLQAVSRKPGESRWTRVATRPFDADVYDDDDARGRPAPRGWLASAPMGDVEESGIVMWGGLGQDDQCMGDGWILRLGD
ncbi:hypothetical protein G6O67_001004 [Ophiocordyceps sinensis]|uniref:Kelch domain-containing protein n=1 Tax=Ophiocordyceps sinensis TaxID=72228 RepID=A0A8H4PWL0_9HYPO|nr:hypothetical protein G6O67_001004 [Ophiocordyceps sinensis]